MRVLNAGLRSLVVASTLACALLLLMPSGRSSVYVTASVGVAGAQESPIAVPNDATRVYYADAQNKIVPLPFEEGITSLNPGVVAESDKESLVELKGARAATVLASRQPRFYVFVADRMDPPPHQLVRLMSRKGGRRFTASVIKGRKGYLPLDTENVRLDYRIIERLQVEVSKNRILFINYMEIRPRTPLSTGEYAIIGNSLADIATFRIE
jgi:hypothetical protein